jgi:hypothetical protein
MATKWTKEKLQEVAELAVNYNLFQLSELMGCKVLTMEHLLWKQNIKAHPIGCEPEYFNWGCYPNDSIFITCSDPKAK